MRLIILAVYLSALTSVCAADEAYTYFDNFGIQLYTSSNYTEALDYFNKSLDQNSSFVNAWIHKGETQKMLRNYKASVESFKQALKVDNKTIAAWSGLIDAYSALKDYANASIAASNVTTLGPKNKYSWQREGQLLQLQGRYSESEPRFDCALSIDPKYQDALYGKALTEISLGKGSKAIELLDQVLSIDPKYKYAYNAKGLTLMQQKKYSDALTAFDKALEIDPYWNQALNNKMHVLLALGRQNEAMKIFVKV